MDRFYLKLLTWGIQQDDPDARDVERRLSRIWPRLKPEDQGSVLGLAETYARASMTEAKWKPNEYRKDLVRMRRLGLSAVHLAAEFDALSKQTDLFSGFTGVAQGPAALTAIEALRDLAAEVFLVTLPLSPLKNRQVRIRVAKVIRRLLKRRTGIVRWELFCDLVWLASRKQIRLSERTARRDAGKKLWPPISSGNKAAATRS